MQNKIYRYRYRYIYIYIYAYILMNAKKYVHTH